MKSQKIPEDIRERYIELQTLDQQVKMFQEKMEKFEEQYVELATVVNDLNDFNDVKADSDVLVPVHNGIFAKAKITVAGKLHVNVGSGVIVEKSVEEVKEILMSQAGEIKKAQMVMKDQIDLMIERIKILDQELTNSMQD